jgi:intein/homing endonuclease
VGETHIDTEFGSKYIKDLNIGENVWSFNVNNGTFELTSVKNKINSGVKEIIKIRTRHNFIESSKNHPILIFNTITNTLEYKQSSDIKIGDLLVINSNENKKSKISYINTELSGFNKNGWKNNVKYLPTAIDREFSELMGFLIGDGWLNGENTRVSFAIGTDDVQNKYYASILEKYSGKTGTWLSPKKNSGGQFYIDSKMLATILFNNGLIGKAKTKRIPEWVFESNEDIQLSFIKGLTNADAWSFDDGFANRYTISLCNKDLIYDFKRLLQINNIKSSIPIEDDTVSEVTICGIDCIKHGEYSINYYLDGNEKKQLKKYNHLNNSNVLLEPVVSVEFIGEKETWDIQVESENSNFVGNGIVVHNSMIEPGRRVWKQLSLLEDAMLIHRIMRAPEKRIFKIDIGNIPPNEVDNFMEKTISKLKKVPYVDERTGDYNLKFNLQNMVEDFYLPVRGSDSGASIDTLPGMEFTGIDDLEYVKNKMMAALKIPKAFLGYEEGLSGKATLAAEDVRFARTIGRLQKMVISELNKIAQVHLYAQGYRDESIVDFTIGLTNPSTIFEKEKMDIWGAKLDNAKSMWEMGDSSGPFFARNFVYKKIFKMSDDDILKNEQEIVDDCKQLWRMKQIVEDGNDPAKPFKKINPNAEGGEEGDGGGNPGGGGGGGLPSMGDIEGGLKAGGEKGGSEAGGDKGGPELKEVVVTEKHGEPGPNYVRPSQAGLKDASKYPRGEDPLGDMENHRDSNADRELTTRPRSDSRLSNERVEPSANKKVLGVNLLRNLDSYLTSSTEIKKELVNESTTTKSILDESNIME